MAEEPSTSAFGRAGTMVRSRKLACSDPLLHAKTVRRDYSGCQTFQTLPTRSGPTLSVGFPGAQPEGVASAPLHYVVAVNPAP